MKYIESWLCEWINHGKSCDDLAAMLTMAGFEVEEIEPIENDRIYDIAITPNRGDCLSVRGLAREIAAITNKKIEKPITITPVNETINDNIAVNVKTKEGCPRYVGRVIRQVKADTPSPQWLKARLERSNLKTISAIVDVVNYVMLELGQPMHAFDLKTISNSITVRQSIKGEMITLLDNSEKTLTAETMIIADEQKPLAIAGVMGGLDSGVTLQTHDIFLESAYFSPQVIAKQRQYYNLTSDSSYRFERGIDPTMQREAIERATQLILEICGGEPGPVIEVISAKHLPKQAKIKLGHANVNSFLGLSISAVDIAAILERLHFQLTLSGHTWKVLVPPYRHDVSIPEDLIEEIARLYGYDKIPTHILQGPLLVNKQNENGEPQQRIRQAFCDMGYHEIVSYSFTDKKIQQLLDPNQTAFELLNPITAEMNVMRTNLWPGLVNALLYNKSRQQQRVRLFETGVCFIADGKEIKHEPRIGGLIAGLALPEQWGIASRQADFYDLKGDLENVLGLNLPNQDLSYQAIKHPALHPGQSAAIFYKNHQIGLFGALHPVAMQALDLTKNIESVYIFELDLAFLLKPKACQVTELSKFPEIRRDIAIIVNDTVPAKAIQDTIKGIAGDWLKDIFIFDVYKGKGISPGCKSVAVGLILQHPTRTLVDDEVTALMDRVTSTLKGQLGAELRS